MGRMAAAGREVGEERLLGILGANGVKPFDGLIRHCVRQVVGRRLVAVSRVDADDLLVLGKDGVPLPGAAAEEAIEVLEAPTRRPAVERPRRSLLPIRGQVPLAEGGGAVAVVAQDPRQRRAVAGQRGGVARVPARELADRAEADRVAIASGQQRCPGGRADGRDMEAVVAHAALGDARVVRRLDGAAEGARIAEAGVIDEHEQDVRRAVGRRRMADQVPVRLGAGQGLRDSPGERRPADGKVAPIDFGHQKTLLSCARQRSACQVPACQGQVTFRLRIRACPWLGPDT